MAARVARGHTWGRRGRLGAGAIACLGAMAFAPSLAHAAQPDAPTTVVVRALPGDESQATFALLSAGGSVVQQLPALDIVVGSVGASHLEQLATSPGVAEVTPNGGLQLLDDNWGQWGNAPPIDPGDIAINATTTGVRDLWSHGATGQGVDVALIDSGVSPVTGLNTPGQILNGPDLSFESQAPNLTHLDTFGHGTHMASIIVGHDANVDPRSLSSTFSGFIGVAPGARLVSLKIADATGGTDVTQVLAAIDWVVQHRNSDGMNIRVLNLSLGTDSTQPYVIDPLAHAAEVAWRNGIVVVVAAGNQGQTRTGLSDPANDPYVIAAGAGDVGTSLTSLFNLQPASFTARGDGARNPDLLAPGTHIIGLRDPGSFIDQQYPGGRVGSRFFRGSGTSQAAAYVTGTVADILSARPDLSPDQVKSLIRADAAPIAGVDATRQGAGVLHVQGILGQSPTGGAQTWQQSTGGGSVEASRGSYHVYSNGAALTGERDIFSQPLATGQLAAAEESVSAWSGGVWNGNTWTGSTWSGSTWSGSTWSGSTWSGSTWSGSTWSGSTWSGSTWSASTWCGSTWSGSTWSASTWSAAGWA